MVPGGYQEENEKKIEGRHFKNFYLFLKCQPLVDGKNPLYKFNFKYTKILSWYTNNMPTFKAYKTELKCSLNLSMLQIHFGTSYDLGKHPATNYQYLHMTKVQYCCGSPSTNLIPIHHSLQGGYAVTWSSSKDLEVQGFQTFEQLVYLVNNI